MKARVTVKDERSLTTIIQVETGKLTTEEYLELIMQKGIGYTDDKRHIHFSPNRIICIEHDLEQDN